MAKRVNDGIEPIQIPAGTNGAGSGPRPSEALARSVDLAASRPIPDHEEAKRRLTEKAVAPAEPQYSPNPGEPVGQPTPKDQLQSPSIGKATCADETARSTLGCVELPQRGKMNAAETLSWGAFQKVLPVNKWGERIYRHSHDWPCSDGTFYDAHRTAGRYQELPFGPIDGTCQRL